MDLRLTRRGDYAVRAALALARAWDGAGYLKTRDIAADMDLPVSYAPQVMALLVTAGLAEGKAGPDGGHRLHFPPSEVTLLQVVDAAESGASYW